MYLAQIFGVFRVYLKSWNSEDKEETSVANLLTDGVYEYCI